MNSTHYQNIIDFDFINKFHVNTAYKIPRLEKIILRSSIRDSDYEQSVYFPKSIFLLEIITFQRAFVKNYKTSMKGKGQRQCSFNGIVTLRHNQMYNFINYFLHFVFLALKNNFLTINLLNDENTFSFCLKDVTIFPGVAEHFIKWPYPLFFTLLLNTRNRYYLQFFLRNYSIYTKTKG